MTSNSNGFAGKWLRRLTPFARPAAKQMEPPPAGQPPRQGPPPLHVSGSMLSDVGLVRQINEDTTLYVAPRADAPQARVGFLALVADGMGGHAAGEVASAMAAETVRAMVYASAESPPRALAMAFLAANDAIFRHGQAFPETRGMGTTCTAVLVRDSQLFFAHVGDSRAYLLRRGAMFQLSDDQTLHAKLIREGLMTPEEAAVSPGGNFILQALGARENVEPTVSEQGLPLEPGDRLLLCSDGLHGLVTDAEIARVARADEPEEACRTLIEMAKAAGGHDNISVGLFIFSDAPPEAAAEGAATRSDLKAQPG